MAPLGSISEWDIVSATVVAVVMMVIAGLILWFLKWAIRRLLDRIKTRWSKRQWLTSRWFKDCWRLVQFWRSTPPPDDIELENATDRDAAIVIRRCNALAADVIGRCNALADALSDADPHDPNIALTVTDALRRLTAPAPDGTPDDTQR